MSIPSLFIDMQITIYCCKIKIEKKTFIKKSATKIKKEKNSYFRDQSKLPMQNILDILCKKKTFKEYSNLNENFENNLPMASTLANGCWCFLNE